MRKIQKPKITIITVVKNGMPYIEDAISSFNGQSYNHKELVVVCSKSTDGTEEWLKKNKNKIDKLIFDNRSQNKYEAINLGIKNATGNIIGVLHADDFFASNNILKKMYLYLVQFLQFLSCLLEELLKIVLQYLVLIY